MYFDDVSNALPVRLPEMFAKHFSCDDLAGVAHQEFQHAEFGGRETELVFVARRATVGEIERQRPYSEDQAGAILRAASNRLEPRSELDKCKGFDEVVIG